MALATSRIDISEGKRRMADDDVRIMERIRDDDRDAVVELVQRYQNELVGFFYHQCWDQLVAEELAQDVFVNVYRSRARYQHTAKVRTYLYRIAHNLWIDHIRRRKHHQISLDAEAGESALRLVDVLKAPVEIAPDAAAEDRVRLRIQDAVASLPTGQREVFVMANNHGLKYQEIAEILGIPEGTVKSRMHSAVHYLRDELQDLVEP
jgi:RNA polymerase sigma-70 factor, ECF subfamily